MKETCFYRKTFLLNNLYLTSVLIKSKYIDDILTKQPVELNLAI